VIVDFSREHEPKRRARIVKAVMQALVILITEEIADASGQ